MNSGIQGLFVQLLLPGDFGAWVNIFADVQEAYGLTMSGMVSGLTRASVESL
jgi:hypothetical protein